MNEKPPTTADLLNAWRETTRAAELAERLATLAGEAAEQADQNALASEQIARMAERAATAAERAARGARDAANRAMELAQKNRAGRLPDAQRAVLDARAGEDAARERYHEAEADAHRRVDGSA